MVEPVETLTVEQTPIPGLLVVRMPLHGDARGWFKENWQREKMVALGLPDFGPVQNNISFNASRGATRGIHTEPWDKFISLATGRIFGAWVDMREGESFGTTFHLEVDPSVAVFVPRGVGNSYQALEDGTAYTYLVNDHWRPGVTYPALHLGDETGGHPVADPARRGGDLRQGPAQPRARPTSPRWRRRRRSSWAPAASSAGRSSAALPGAEGVTRATLDVTDAAAVAAWPWHEYAVVLNAAAYTAVDAAETPEGRRAAWAANATAPATLARLAPRARLHPRALLLGVRLRRHRRGARRGRAADPARASTPSPRPPATSPSATAPRHYLLRTSWVIGEGKNFVRTMQSLAGNGVSPSVVADQVGRLTFTDELVRATRHLLESGADARHLPRLQRRAGDVVGRGRAGGLRAVAAGRPTTSRPSTPSSTPPACSRRATPSPRARCAPRCRWTSSRATGFEPEDALVALDRYLTTPAG